MGAAATALESTVVTTGEHKAAQRPSRRRMIDMSVSSRSIKQRLLEMRIRRQKFRGGDRGRGCLFSSSDESAGQEEHSGESDGVVCSDESGADDSGTGEDADGSGEEEEHSGESDGVVCSNESGADDIATNDEKLNVQAYHRPPPPCGFRISHIESTSCEAFWRSPHVDRIEEAATSFIVQVKRAGTECTMPIYHGSEWHCQIGNLSPNTVYCARIASENSFGLSFFTSFVAFRTRAFGTAKNGSGQDKTTFSPPIETKGLLPTRVFGMWSEYFDEISERFFYKNRRDGHTSWNLPSSAHASEDTLMTSSVRLKRYRLYRKCRADCETSPQAQYVLRINRRLLLEDSVRSFSNVPEESWISHRFRIEYTEEEGVGVGVKRDFYLSISRALFSFDDKIGLFLPHEAQNSGRSPVESDRLQHVPLLAIDPTAKTEVHQRLWCLVGRFLAKALRERMLVVAPLPGTVWMQLCGRETSATGSTMTRLALEKPVVHKNFEWMLRNDVEEASLGVNFQIYQGRARIPPINIRKALVVAGDEDEEEMSNGALSVEDAFVDIVPGGNAIEVTNANKQDYVKRAAEFYVNKSTALQVECLLRGFDQVIPIAHLRDVEMGPDELQSILCGDPKIDVDELKKQSVCTNGLTPTSRVVIWFWRWLRTSPTRVRQSLLEFATGCPRFPLDGFDPPFELKGTGESSESLPRAQTCFHQLILPNYTTYEDMDRKLRLCMKHSFGFQFL